MQLGAPTSSYLLSRSKCSAHWFIRSLILPLLALFVGACTSDTPQQPRLGDTTSAVTPVVISSATTLPASTQDVAYSTTLTATGGNGTFTWAISEGALPAGITLSNSGLVSGTPSAFGTFAFTIRVTSGSSTTSGNFTLVVAPPALAITTTTLANGSQGIAYTATLVAKGGSGTYTWSLANGTLPVGISLSAAGVLSGTPTTFGSFPITVAVASGAQSQTAQFILVIAPPPLLISTAALLPEGNQGSPYSATLIATGGTGTFVWEVASGTLPTGLSLSATGVLSGTTNSSGASLFTARVTSGTQSAIREFILNFAATPVVINTAAVLPSGSPAVPYTTTLSASGGVGNYVWSLASGTLPPGLTLTTAGIVAGTPTTAGTFAFNVRVTSASQTASRNFTIVIAPPTLVITSGATLASGVQGTQYSALLAASGGVGAYTWAVESGALPNGITLSPSNGALTGVPTATGVFAFSAKVTSGSQSDTKSFTITIAPPTLTITTSATLSSVPQGLPYALNFSASGGIGGYAWTIASGALPPGLTLGNSGAISGTPTASGTYSFSVTVTSGAQTDTCAFTLVITAPPTLVITTNTTLAGAQQGVSYSNFISATGGNGTYVWTVTAGALPPGLSLNASSGAVGGTPTVGGTYTFSVRVTSGSQTDTRAFTLIVSLPTLTISTGATLTAGSTGVPYSTTLAATGGGGSYSWSVTVGSLPAGLSLNATSGAISGTPTTNGTHSFSVTVASGAQTDTRAFTLVITAPPTLVITTTATLAGAQQGVSYSNVLSATGGNGSYVWAVTAGALPPGLSLNASSGAIGGTPTVGGTYTFSIRVASGLQTDTRVFTLIVALPTLTISTGATLPAGSAGVSYSTTLAATGGTGSYSWSVTVGSLPAGLSLNATSGVISGTPTTPGLAAFTATVTSGSQTTTRAFSISIAGSLRLAWPLGGTNGIDWVVTNYVDLDQGSSGMRDYTGATGTNAKTYDNHNGIDISVPNFRWMDQSLTPIYAAAAGTVIASHDGEFDRNVACMANNPNYVTIRHSDGSFVEYLHMKQGSVAVVVGQQVAAGTRLGLVGSSGCSTGPHLHFAMYDASNTLVDPFQKSLWINPPPYSAPVSLLDIAVRTAQFTSTNFVAGMIDPTPNISSVVSGSIFGFGLSLANGVPGDEVRLVVRNSANVVTLDSPYRLTSELRLGFLYWNLQLSGVGTSTVSIYTNSVLVKTHSIAVTASIKAAGSAGQSAAPSAESAQGRPSIIHVLPPHRDDHRIRKQQLR